MRYIELYNGVKMPQIMMGTSTDDFSGKKDALFNHVKNAIACGLSLKTIGFDTARDYQNEPLLGKLFEDFFKSGICTREDVFITTKVGNKQQRYSNMQKEIDMSLTALRLDYIDLWLLHWPLPDFWLNNWEQMTDIYKTGKVKAIGIANCRERHIREIKNAGLPMPHVMQVEYHPFRTINSFRDLCAENHIQIEAYSANCLMLPFVRDNYILNKIANNHKKTVTQIIMRWHVQQGVVPIFRSFNPKHIEENVDIFDFSLTESEMSEIFSLNENYKFHPESLNCPGY